MAAMFNTLLFVLAVFGGAYADTIGDCYSVCGDTRECSALVNLSRTEVQRCLQFVHSQCVNSDDLFKCLASYISTTQSGCTRNIVENEIPCLKCEDNCDKLDSNGSPPPPAIADNSEEEKKCFDACGKTRECSVFYGAQPAKKKRCERYTDTMCGRNMHPIECFERLKDKEKVGCSKLYRRDGLACLKCGDNCARQYAKNPNEGDKKCIEECSKKPSCKITQSATEKRIVDCRKMSDGMCSSETHPIVCLESLKNVNNEMCPKAFRDHLITCMKCDANCTAPSGGPPQGTLPLNEGQKCVATCDSTAACRTLGSATRAKVEACDKYLNSMCAREEHGTPCLDKLRATPSNDCQLGFRKSMADCLKCRDNCDEVHGNVRRNVEMCLGACSNIPSCTAMENSSDQELTACYNVFERQCGNNDDIISCMESYTTEDASCSKMLRGKMIDCMKCQRRCEQGEVEGSRALPPPSAPSAMPAASMTKKKCEKSCDTSLGCDMGNKISPECMGCLNAQCGSKNINCYAVAIAGDCRTQCAVLNNNAKKEMCDNCKAKCAIHPWYVCVGIKRASNTSLDEI